MKKRRLLIVTLNDYVIYQPTILNLYDRLIAQFEVSVISFQPAYVTKKKDLTRNVIYLKPSKFITFAISKFDFLMSKVSRVVKFFDPKYIYQYRYYNTYLPELLEKWLKANEPAPDLVIAVDLPALIVAQKVYGSVHFLSLEVENRDSDNYRKFDPALIESVMIQTPDRLDYILPDFRKPVFFVQNSPVFTTFDRPKTRNESFIYAGTARKVFGIFECIDFIRSYPGYKLVQKGGGERKVLKAIRKHYADLIDAGKLVLDNSYLNEEEFIRFISRYRIGFCFYSWHLINTQFNYRTAPSGKLFMYMGAGVPVIAADIPGFEIVRRFRAGILIKDYSPGSIKKAVEIIESDYENFSQNSLKLAESVSFDKLVEPYIDFLSNWKSNYFDEG